MNLADLMLSQDNIHNVASHERGKDNLLPVNRMTVISVRRYDQQITGKNGSM